MSDAINTQADAEIQNAADAFVAKWQGVTASELSTSQSFLIELSQLLGLDAPHATAEQDYMFERPITFAHGDGSTSAGRIDLYRRGAFVLESKKLRQSAHTKGFDDAMLRARSQAEGYARALPASEGRPPFLIVVDVGHRIELYSEFSRSGATYTPFPDPRSHRIALADLRQPEIRNRLRRVWLDPAGLDPSRESARVTREIATRLAKLAQSLEQARHDPEVVAQFLMRCLFTMFAEDVKLLPQDSFRQLLIKHAEQPDIAMRMLAQLWRDMDSGGFSAVIAGDVLRFNGKLFKQPDTLPLDTAQLTLLIEAARADWKHVEPAIFGTLLERALSPGERHRLGAHYTPRAYVERLVLPTVIEPLRKEWGEAQAAAMTLAAEDKPDDAVKELRRFHHRLCIVRVLDPACGSGNFLYVTLEHLKRLEGEVLLSLDELGYRQTGLALDGERADATAGETVDPHNLLGIELNPRAAAIAEVVLWIGYLQWHFRTRGDVFPPQPVIRDFRNIENRDAVLAYDRFEFELDDRGIPLTRWDGETMKVSPVTGEKVPDDTARKPVVRYVNPRQAAWPDADFVVGNPPFIGKRNMRNALGDGYVEALRAAWSDVPESADFVVYWWHRAANLARTDQVLRFGFITTNSLRQTFNRRVIELHREDKKQPLSLVYAIPDHPWVDSIDGAAVRIAMTVGEAGGRQGRLLTVTAEQATSDGEIGVQLDETSGIIQADLTAGINLATAIPLRSNLELSNIGVIPLGAGFIVSHEQMKELATGFDEHITSRLFREYRNGKDLADRPRGVYAIDTFELSEDQLRTTAPSVWQWLYDHVKPGRDQNARKNRRERWWRYGEEHPRVRRAIAGLPRYIATVMTAKHRIFQFLDGELLPDQKLVAVGLDDPKYLGILSSVVHGVWALATGSRLGVGNDPVYVKTLGFECFPFLDFHAAEEFGGAIGAAPVDENRWAGESQTNGEYLSDRIRNLAEQLDAHRKLQQERHPGLTMTGMYNVLEKLRSGDVLTPKDRTLHEQGLVSVLRQLHDELDAAVLSAYGWSDLLSLLRIAHGNDAPSEDQTRDYAKRAFDVAILQRLVALNVVRAAEEARGQIRWLRPEFQNPVLAREHQPEQVSLTADTEKRDRSDDEIAAITLPPSIKPQPWPKDAIEQVRAVADVLAGSGVPLSTDEIAARFTARGPWKRRLPKLLEMLVALGRAKETDGRFTA